MCGLTSIPGFGLVSITVRRLLGGVAASAVAITATVAPIVSLGFTPVLERRHSTYTALYFRFQFSLIV